MCADKSIETMPLPKSNGASGSLVIDHFAFHGMIIRVQSSNAELAEQVRRDFSYFRASSNTTRFDLHVELKLEEPAYGDLPALPASFLTPRNVCYQHTPVSYIDYFGRGLATYNRVENHCLMQAEDLDFLARDELRPALAVSGAPAAPEVGVFRPADRRAHRCQRPPIETS